MPHDHYLFEPVKEVVVSNPSLKYQFFFIRYLAGYLIVEEEHPLDRYTGR